MTSRLLVGWSLSTPCQRIAGADGAKLHQWTRSRTSLSPGMFLHRSGHCAIANYHSGSLSSASIIDQRRGLVTGDIGGVRLVLFCSPSSESILVLDCGMKAALTSMESSDKLWMETCSCFTYMYGSDVLMYYALFSYTVRVCSYFPHAVIQLYLWIRVDCGRLRCQQLLIRDSSLVILLAGKVKKDLAGFLQKQGVKRELKTVKVQIDPGLVKRGNVVDITDAARRQERIVTNEQEACNLFHGGKWYVRVQHWMNMFLHRSTFRYLTHVVLASYSDDIFQLSLNQKVHIV